MSKEVNKNSYFYYYSNIISLKVFHSLGKLDAKIGLKIANLFERIRWWTPISKQVKVLSQGMVYVKAAVFIGILISPYFVLQGFTHLISGIISGIWVEILSGFLMMLSWSFLFWQVVKYLWKIFYPRKTIEWQDTYYPNSKKKIVYTICRIKVKQNDDFTHILN